MSVRVTPWKGSATLFMVTIRFRWTDRTVYRERRVVEHRTEAAARRWGESREALVRRERSTAPESTTTTTSVLVPTLAEFAPRFVEDYARADGHADAGIECKESVLRLHLIPHVGNKRLDAFRNADVQMLKRIWRDGVADPATGAILARPTSRVKTLNNRLTVLGKLLRVAVEWKESTGLLAMPCEVRLIRGDDSVEMGFYEHAVYDKLVEAAGRCGADEHLAVLFAGDAGLRRGEILGVQRGDIVHGKLHVQRQVYFAKAKDTKTREPVVRPTKGKAKRWVPLTPRLQRAIAEQRHLRGPWVLCQPDGAHLTPKLLRMMIQRAERRAELEPFGRLHILRHTFCSHLAMAGASPVSIQILAGHKSLATTMKYMHLSPSAADDAIKTLVNGREVAATAAESVTGTDDSPRGR